MRELGAIEAFVSQMNALARQLGMERTLFVNPHGLEPNKGLQPYSTALDLAKLSAYAMKDAAFRFYVSQKERKISFNRGGQVSQYLLRNTNELVGTAGIDGVKTGRNRFGRRRMVSLYPLNVNRKWRSRAALPPCDSGRRLNVVVLGAADRWRRRPTVAGAGHSTISGQRLGVRWSSSGCSTVTICRLIGSGF
jgi:D-alanyl-D-alanine carboxypeptidase